MFTGLIEGIGTLAGREPRGGDARLRIDAGTLPFVDIALGESIAVNGACLTVAALAPAFAAAWGDPDHPRTLRWPMFVHARRTAAS